MSDEVVRKNWSSNDSDYYKELEKFHKEHAKAHAITIDPELNCPVSATYFFDPHRCYIEREVLKARIALSMLEEPLI